MSPAMDTGELLRLSNGVKPSTTVIACIMLLLLNDSGCSFVSMHDTFISANKFLPS